MLSLLIWSNVITLSGLYCTHFKSGQKWLKINLFTKFKTKSLIHSHVECTYKVFRYLFPGMFSSSLKNKQSQLLSYLNNKLLTNNKPFE